MSDVISRQSVLDICRRKIWNGMDDYYPITAKGIAKEVKDLPSAEPERNGWVHIDDVYRLISGHSNYHGDNILAALTCLAEGKEVLNPINVLEPPEQKTGKWINDQCSNCGYGVNPWNNTPYCPNCGLKMEVTRND